MELRAIVRTLVLSTLALGLVGCDACKRTPEDEKRSFEKNTAEVKKLATLYPGFKAPLEAKLAEATKKFGEAEQITEPEAAVQEMGKANALLSGGFIAELSSLDGRIKKLRERMVTLESKAPDEGTAESAKTAVEQVDRVLEQVQKRLEKGAPDEAAANAIMEQVASDLESAGNILAQVEKTIADKEKAAAAAKAEAEQKAAEEAKKTEPWECGHCGGTNPHTATKCETCDAPRS